jgi:hypothetical protein
MRNIICFLIIIGIFSGVFTACTTYRDTCERYVLGAAFCALSDGKEGRPLYSSVVIPREFFDARDFGRGHDGLYGNPPYWYEKDNASFGKPGFRHHGRTAGCGRDHQNSVYNQHGDDRDSEFK